MIGYILFGLVAAVAVVSAMGMLLSTNAIHAALFLVVNFACIALFYLGLNAPFLAMVQVTVYAGAIMVLFVFVIMLLGAERLSLQSRLRWQAPLAIFLIVVLVVATFLLFLNIEPTAGLTPLEPINEAAQDVNSFGSPHTVGKALFERYLLPFELTGILLLVAMIGAVVLAKDEKKRPEATGHRPEERATSDM